MARGTVTVFNEFLKDMGNGVHDLSADAIKVAMIDNTTPPTAADPTPRWGDYSANEVSGGTSYVAGGATVGTKTWTNAGAVTKLAGDDVGWAMDASGPTDCWWGIVYNSDADNDEAIGFVELDGPVDLQADDIDIEWTGGALYTHTANP
jgi:hypothetical protein